MSAAEVAKHDISIRCEPASRSGALVLNGGHRASCSCGWWSGCYAMMSDTERAIEVHLQCARREEFDALLAKSSIGAALDDIKKRGIDAHLVDLEREMNYRYKPRPKRPGAAKHKKAPR